MTTRREFLATAGAVAFARTPRQSPQPPVQSGGSGTARLPTAANTTGVFPASVRADFPLAAAEAHFNSAAMHPLGTFALQAMTRVMSYRSRGDASGESDFGPDRQQDLKARFGRLIGAKPSEIAFTSSTSDGENIVVLGLNLPRRGGNVVIDELHFTSSLYLFKELEKQGVELRIVKHRDWTIDANDMDRAIDRNTRLVSLALVSNVNGFMPDVKVVSDLAHARGAYLFADIIQAVGAVPVDVRAMGIDFAATGTYKWLMGERGFGFLYVRDELQGAVLPTTRYGHRHLATFNRAQLTWTRLPGAAMYESGGIPVLLAAGVSAGIDYITVLGIDRIRAHAKILTDRLQREVPPLGYPSLTPPATATPIVAFSVKDVAATAKLLQAANVAGWFIANENRLRLSVSVFNTHDDIDRVVAALGGKTSGAR
jgi:selenocysteine lyase/cysteine desulfurase